MGPLTTHVLNTSSGYPAVNMKLEIYKSINDDCNNNENNNSTNYEWLLIGETRTNTDGRGPGILSKQEEENFSIGIYKMIFFTKEYFDNLGEQTFYPKVEVIFRITDINQHYHIPLLISNYGYSTYRGS